MPPSPIALARTSVAGCLLAALVGGSALLAARPADPPAEAPPPAPAKPAERGPVERAPAAKGEEPEIILYLTDGRRFAGFLVERNALEIIIRIAGIKTPFKVEAVDKFEILAPVLERYQELRKAIDDEDVDAILRLKDWLVARQQFEAALGELDALLKRRPTSGPVIRARQALLKQMEMRDKSRTRPIDDAPPSKPREDPREPRDAPDPRGGFEPFPYLSPDDVNLIKVYEVDLAKPPRLEIPRETITALLDRFAGHPAIPSGREGRDAVYRQSPREQLDLLFRVRARDLYPQVRVIDQPESMRVFRDEVQRNWLVNSCATSSCHGGADAGRLILASKRPNSDPAVYTNFYILSQFRTADGSPLVDFETPEKSPLLQMGLAREDALYKHPVVLRAGEPRDAWKPTFRTREDRRYQQAIAFIKSLYRPRPDYGIKYTPARPFVADSKQAPSGR